MSQLPPGQEFDRRRGIGCRLVSMILFDTVRPTRAFLAVVATMWAVTLAFPGNTLDRPVYAFMLYLASESTWVGIWAVLAAALWWRTLAFWRSRWTFVIDVYSVAVFSTSAAALAWARLWPWPSGVNADMCCAGAALWLLARSLAADGFGDHRGQ